MKSILIIDDDAAIRDVYSFVFNREGYDVTCFADEKPILQNNFTEPDIFLIDKQLHGANGIDVCRYLKGRPVNARTPVIIFSASPNSGVQARDAGADAFLEKPFPNKVLLELVNQILK